MRSVLGINRPVSSRPVMIRILAVWIPRSCNPRDASVAGLKAGSAPKDEDARWRPGVGSPYVRLRLDGGTGATLHWAQAPRSGQTRGDAGAQSHGTGRPVRQAAGEGVASTLLAGPAGAFCVAGVCGGSR